MGIHSFPCIHPKTDEVKFCEQSIVDPSETLFFRERKWEWFIWYPMQWPISCKQGFGWKWSESRSTRTTKEQYEDTTYTARQLTHWEWSKKWFEGPASGHNEYDGSTGSGIRLDVVLKCIDWDFNCCNWLNADLMIIKQSCHHLYHHCDIFAVECNFLHTVPVAGLRKLCSREQHYWWLIVLKTVCEDSISINFLPLC